ncbi:hypothetical protein [Paraburkholderia sp. CNPSo 3274]|nr:hypothetical protein [Paraburkholderia sp. CNPSo 3274]
MRALEPGVMTARACQTAVSQQFSICPGCPTILDIKIIYDTLVNK